MNTPIRYTAAITSGATSSAALNLRAAYEYVSLEIPTFASGGTHYVQASQDGSTYRRIHHMVAGVSTPFQSPQTLSQTVIAVPGGYQYYKVENTSGCTDTTTTFGFLCWNK